MLHIGEKNARDLNFKKLIPDTTETRIICAAQFQEEVIQACV